mgnify:FL=1
MVVRGWSIDSSPLFEIEEEIRQAPEDYLFVHLFSMGDLKQLQRLCNSILDKEQKNPHTTVVAKGVINQSDDYKSEIKRLEGSGLKVITRYFESNNYYADNIAKALASLG